MTSTLVLTAASCVVLAAIGLAMIRLFIGPSLLNRVLAANSIGTKIVILIALIAFFFEVPSNILDIALLYALVTFTGTIAVLKFFRDHKGER